MGNSIYVSGDIAVFEDVLKGLDALVYVQTYPKPKGVPVVLVYCKDPQEKFNILGALQPMVDTGFLVLAA